MAKKEKEIVEEENVKVEEKSVDCTPLFYNLGLTSMIQGIAGFEAAFFILAALDSMEDGILTIFLILLFLNIASSIPFGILGIIKGKAKAKGITGLVLTGLSLLIFIGILLARS